uniref:Uncharacterized protein n=1 Tax=Bos indicus x Bos taurus TaxID=30522 RepID=A0A4W2EP71_BOBOX
RKGYRERLPVNLLWPLEGPPLRRLRLPRSAFGLNGHSRRRCRSPCAWFCPYSFPGDRPGSSSGCGRHVVRRRRGCLKDGLAEAAASAAGGGGGGGSGGSGSVEPCRLSIRPVPRPDQCPRTLPLLRAVGERLDDSARPSEETRRGFSSAQIPDHLAFPSDLGSAVPRILNNPPPAHLQLCSQPRLKSFTHTGVPLSLQPPLAP